MNRLPTVALAFWLLASSAAVAQTEPVSAPPGQRRPHDLASLIRRSFQRERKQTPKPTILPASVGDKRRPSAPIQAHMQAPIFDGPEVVETPPPEFQIPMPVQVAPGTTIIQVPPGAEIPIQAPPVLPAPTEMPSGPEPRRPAAQPEASEPEYVEVPEPKVCDWWHRFEFLLLNTPDGNLPVSLAYSNTSGIVATLFSTPDMDYGNYPGFRYTMGKWLDRAHNWGVEADGWFARAPDVSFFANSSSLSALALPLPLARQYIDPTTGTLTFMNYGTVSNTTGGINIESGSTLWGAGLHVTHPVWRRPTCQISLLAGGRVLDLQESLDVLTTISPLATGQVSFKGGDVPVNTIVSVNDHFGTRNRFGGFNFAARCEWQCDAMFVNVQGGLAVGSTKQTVDVIGNSTNPATGSMGLGGFLAQPTNIGTQSDREFSVVPEVNLTIGVQCGRHCRIFGGYDLLWWNVVRPGNQIDPLINLNNAPVTVTTTGTTFTFAPGTGPPVPAPQFNTESIFIQGLRLGFEVLF